MLLRDCNNVDYDICDLDIESIVSGKLQCCLLTFVLNTLQPI